MGDKNNTLNSEQISVHPSPERTEAYVSKCVDNDSS